MISTAAGCRSGIRRRTPTHGSCALIWYGTRGYRRAIRHIATACVGLLGRKGLGLTVLRKICRGAALIGLPNQRPGSSRETKSGMNAKSI